jgi:hypothetical protein
MLYATLRRIKEHARFFILLTGVMLCTLHSLLSAAGSKGLQEQPSSQVTTQEKTAEQANKNIQVFKGMPASKLRSTMFFFRYALGVNCTQCHVFGQFDQDVKSSKAKAREMIRMVQEINKNFFKGRTEVNCYTCHQGTLTPRTEIPATRIGLQSILGPRPEPKKEENALLPSVDQVLASYAEALGGKEALAKVNSISESATLITTEGRIIPREIYRAAPDMMLDVKHTGSEMGDFVDGFDGKVAWRKDNRGVSEKNGEQLAQARMDAVFEFPSKMKDLYSRLSVFSQEKVDQEPAYVLVGRSSLTGNTERLYFGSQSGLLLRRSVVTENYVGSISTDTYYEDYRAVDGVKSAMLVSTFGPDAGAVMKITRIEHNIPLNEGKFKKPEK